MREDRQPSRHRRATSLAGIRAFCLALAAAAGPLPGALVAPVVAWLAPLVPLAPLAPLGVGAALAACSRDGTRTGTAAGDTASANCGVGACAGA